MASYYEYENATPYRLSLGVQPQTGDLVIVKTTLMFGSDLPFYAVGYIVEAPDNCRYNDAVVLLNGQTREIHYTWLRKVS